MQNREDIKRKANKVFNLRDWVHVAMHAIPDDYKQTLGSGITVTKADIRNNIDKAITALYEECK